jgi:septal ring factor EnvC (AmiA/AmiB activator)
MGPAALAALRLLFDRARTYAKEYNSERRPQNLLALRNAVAAFRDALCAGPVGPAPAQLNQINQLTNDLTQRNQTIQTQNTEIVDLRVQVARLNHDLNDYKTTIEDQQAELEELRELREEMNRDDDNDDDDDDDNNNNDDSDDNDDSKAPPDDAKIGSGEKDQLIARLRHAGLKLRNKKDALKGIIAERDERITALEKDVKKYSTALATIAERDSNALATIAERDAQIRSLQKQLSELGQELSAERKHKKPRSGTGPVSPDESVTDQQNARAGSGHVEPRTLARAMQAAEEGAPAMQAAEEGANP